MQAAANYDVPALMGMFGSDGKDIVSSADAFETKTLLPPLPWKLAKRLR
ncbi:hypothetical protein RBB81_08490 [Tunturibacter gelidoferens]|uniref:Uncharacterized protein n=1 Tax=Tunturiibacter gelidiferens TaxID=3069689 RepID=A0AAU7Z6W5_9BACT